MDEQIRNRLAECIKLWNSAEKAVKEAELINRKLNEPAVNELRYAGRWIILALDAFLQNRDKIDGLTSLQDALAYARLCCIQSKHDAIDSIVLFLHDKIDQIGEKYTSRVISMYVKNYVDFMGDVEKIDSFIVMSRQDRHNRLKIYDDIFATHLPRVREFLLAVKRAEMAMNDELQHEKDRIERETERHNEIVTGLQSDARTNKQLFWWSFAINVLLALTSIGLGIAAFI